jgi:hypothetical protein
MLSSQAKPRQTTTHHCTYRDRYTDRYTGSK